MMKKTALLSAIISSALCSTNVMAEVTLNGFASVGIGLSDQDAGRNGYNKDIETMPDSLAAVQLGYDINDKMTATMQIMARGSENWEPEMEWAYLSYQTEQGSMIRAGKLRAPFYMYSDYLDVRYAQPFLRPNNEVYGLVAFSSYTGLDAVIPIEMGDSQFMVQPFYGTVETTAKALGLDFELKNLFGANLSWEWESLMLRAIYAQGDMQSESPEPAPMLLDEKTGKFMGFGFKYEPGDFFLLGEFGRREVTDQFPDADAAYLGTGYHFGVLSPYLMYGWLETQDDAERAPDFKSFNDKRTSISVGMRWDLMSSVALKADITHYDNFLDDKTDNNGDKLDDANVFTVSIDTVF